MGLIEIIIIFLVIAWLGGYSKIGGGLIHLLLIIAVVILLARLLGVNI